MVLREVEVVAAEPFRKLRRIRFAFLQRNAASSSPAPARTPCPSFCALRVDPTLRRPGAGRGLVPAVGGPRRAPSRRLSAVSTGTNEKELKYEIDSRAPCRARGRARLLIGTDLKPGSGRCARGRA